MVAFRKGSRDVNSATVGHNDCRGKGPVTGNRVGESLPRIGRCAVACMASRSDRRTDTSSSKRSSDGLVVERCESTIAQSCTMIVNISSDAEDDVAEGFWFYDRQSAGLGDYFRSCIIADIDSLVFYSGIDEVDYGYHRSLSKTFPVAISYRVDGDVATGVRGLSPR